MTWMQKVGYCWAMKWSFKWKKNYILYNSILCSLWGQQSFQFASEFTGNGEEFEWSSYKNSAFLLKWVTVVCTGGRREPRQQFFPLFLLFFVTAPALSKRTNEHKCVGSVLTVSESDIITNRRKHSKLTAWKHRVGIKKYKNGREGGKGGGGGTWLINCHFHRK